MSWMYILNDIFNLIVIPFIGIATVALTAFIKCKIGEIKQKNNNELARKSLEYLCDIICDCVIATNQTYVNALKKEGKFDIEAQKNAFKQSYEAVMNILSDDVKLYLSSIVGDLELYVTNKIESDVMLYKEDSIQ